MNFLLQQIIECVFHVRWNTLKLFQLATIGMAQAAPAVIHCYVRGSIMHIGIWWIQMEYANNVTISLALLCSSRNQHQHGKICAFTMTKSVPLKAFPDHDIIK